MLENITGVMEKMPTSLQLSVLVYYVDDRVMHKWLNPFTFTDKKKNMKSREKW